MVLMTGGVLAMSAFAPPALASAGGSPAAISRGHGMAPAGRAVLALGSGCAADAARVRGLQLRLAEAGYSPGRVDGCYGPLTERAVARFQAAHRLQIDGIAGPVTLAALRRPSAVLYPGAGYTAGGSAEVRTLQRRVAALGFSPGPVDGRYGPLTERAVARFQAAHRLQVDGIAGPRTLAGLQPARAARPRGAHPHPRPPARSRGGSHPKPTAPRRSPGASHYKAPAPAGSRGASQHEPVVPARARAQASRRGGSTSQPGGSPPIGVLVVIGLLGLAIGMTGAWAIRQRRREHREAIASRRFAVANGSPSPNGALPGPEPEVGPPSSSNGHDVERASDPAENKQAPAGVSEDAVGAASGGGGQPDAVSRETTYRRLAEAGDAVAAWRLGVLLEQRGDMPEAEAAYRRADERGDANGAFMLGGLLVGRGDMSGAVSAYRRADKRGDAAAACNLGMLLEHEGDLAGAEAAYRRADTRGDANGAFNLGGLLADRGDLSGAASAYRRADERGDAGAACNLGVLLEQDGNLAGAEAYYRRALERGHAPAALNVGRLLERRGNSEAALAAYQHARRLNDPEVAEMAHVRVLELTGATHDKNRTGGEDAR